MTYAKQMGLVKKLAELTKAGVIDWQLSLNDGMFQVSFRDNTVRVAKKTSQSGSSIIEIELLNGNGGVVESFDDEDLDGESMTAGTTSSWYRVMYELHSDARRTALGAEKVLDEIISDLDDMLPF